ncbi:hypothetical protein FRB91_005826 [Serendipita sp. 411]|nr:hypothetical protein FRB91_005826 [Serendipita sp. 411]
MRGLSNKETQINGPLWGRHISNGLCCFHTSIYPSLLEITALDSNCKEHEAMPGFFPSSGSQMKTLGKYKNSESCFSPFYFHTSLGSGLESPPLSTCSITILRPVFSEGRIAMRGYIKLELWVWITILLQVLSSRAYNRTVDHSDPSIAYFGTWLTTNNSGIYYNTSHYTKVKGSYVTFAFTSAAQIHFMGLANPRIAVDTSIEIVLDGQTHVVNIYRQGSQSFQTILWSSGALDPTTKHAITCRKTSESNGDRDLYVNAFIMSIPGVAPQSSSVGISTAPGIPSASSSLSSRSTAINSTTFFGASATVTGSSTMISRITNAVFSVGTPVYEPVPTSESLSNVTIQAPIGGSSNSSTLPKTSSIIIAFSAVGFISMIAAIYFYLRRRKRASQLLEAHDTKGAPVDEQRAGQIEISESGQLGTKKGGNHPKALYHQEPTSPISSGNTQSCSSYIGMPSIAYDSLIESSENPESDTTILHPPAYTFRPTSDYTSITASHRLCRSHKTEPNICDISSGDDHFDEARTE